MSLLNRIKVLIVDDDDVWREGLRQYLAYDPQIQVIGEAFTKESAITFIRQTSEVDVVLMDINLSGTLFDGIDTMLELSELSDCKFIMLTSFQQKEVIHEAFSSGAMNYITKQYVECIPQAIKDAHLNQASIHHSASAIVRSEWIRLSKNITNREVELLQYMGKGYSLQQISDALHIEKQSVSNSVGRISRKLGYARFNRSIIERVRRWGWFQ
jgi:DNA-binding NarL/FixJ family response regulator